MQMEKKGRSKFRFGSDVSVAPFRGR